MICCYYILIVIHSSPDTADHTFSYSYSLLSLPMCHRVSSPYPPSTSSSPSPALRRRTGGRPAFRRRSSLLPRGSTLHSSLERRRLANRHRFPRALQRWGTRPPDNGKSRPPPGFGGRRDEFPPVVFNKNVTSLGVVPCKTATERQSQETALAQLTSPLLHSSPTLCSPTSPTILRP